MLQDAGTRSSHLPPNTRCRVRLTYRCMTYRVLHIWAVWYIVSPVYEKVIRLVNAVEQVFCCVWH